MEQYGTAQLIKMNDIKAHSAAVVTVADKKDKRFGLSLFHTGVAQGWKYDNKTATKIIKMSKIYAVFNRLALYNHILEKIENLSFR